MGTKAQDKEAPRTLSAWEHKQESAATAFNMNNNTPRTDGRTDGGMAGRVIFYSKYKNKKKTYYVRVRSTKTFGFPSSTIAATR